MNKTSQQPRKMEQKKKRRKDMLHRLKVHGLPTANEIKADLRLFEMAEDPGP